MTNGFTDKFAPLEMPELEISGTTSAIDYSEGELVTTIPWDAPSPPLIHTRHGEAIAHWTYLNSEGEEVFRIVRFEFPNGHKAVLPQTLWKARDGKLEWRWKAMPSPRPLYRLNELKNKPNASVIIVEGEKAADAAALVFKNSAVITSSGGANAASKTDWNPLKGRRVRIWPDN
ncbi:MAG: hypothetical protein EB015_14805, partial [Methylocystaceae bacterium]|nr:hypothetical protein [Methylocystaceae bacterium]